MSLKRKLLDGSEVESLTTPVQLIIHTKAPEKWKIVDMETGEEYLGSDISHPTFSTLLKQKVSKGHVGSWKKIKFRINNE
jgi:hypothetical protein